MYTVPLLRALCQNITVQFNVLAETICHTIPLHVLINLLNTDVQLNVLVEMIYHTVPLYVLISPTNILSVILHQVNLKQILSLKIT